MKTFEAARQLLSESPGSCNRACRSISTRLVSTRIEVFAHHRGSDTFALAGSTLAQIEGKETLMKRLLPLSLALVLVSSCAVGLYHNNRNRTRVEAQPEFYGTVTYFDPVAHRIDLDYVENGTHQTRNVYYNTQATRWNGVRDNEVRTGDRIVVRGHQDKGRWQADEVRRHE
jgi:hypothetical protein